MQILSEVTIIIFEASLVIAGLAGITILVLFLKYGSGDNISGNTVILGSGMLEAIMAGFLAVFPLFFDNYGYVNALAPNYYFKFWIIYLLALGLGVSLKIIKKRRVRIIELIYPLIALVGASWSAQVINKMEFVFGSNETLFVKIILMIFGAAYTILYFLTPMLLFNLLDKSLQERKLQKNSNSSQG